jgi:hypothetical protein
MVSLPRKRKRDEGEKKGNGGVAFLADKSVLLFVGFGDNKINEKSLIIFKIYY